MISTKSMNCWKVFRVDKLTVFSPLWSVSVLSAVDGQAGTHASVMALTVRKSESV